jgi:hypothetical protein
MPGVRGVLAIEGGSADVATHVPRLRDERGLAPVLTTGQRRFVEAVCELIAKAISDDTDGEHVIDIDRVADQGARTNERPSFYYTEETQQTSTTARIRPLDGLVKKRQEIPAVGL